MSDRYIYGSLLLFAFTSAFSITLSQTFLFIAALLAIAWVLVNRSFPNGPDLKWFWIAVGVYLLWLVLVCLIQDDPLRSLDHIREEWLLVAVPVGLIVWRDETRFRWLVTALAAGLLLVSLSSVLMYLFGVQYDWGEGFSSLPETNPRVRGNFAHALTFGNYAAISSAFLIAWGLAARRTGSGWLKVLALSAGGIGLVAVLLCGSRGPVMAFMAGAVVMLVLLGRAGRKWLAGLMVLLVVIGLAVPSVRSRFSTELGWHFNSDWAGGRIFIWERSLAIVGDHPWLGVGPGNFSEAYRARLNPEVGDRYWYGHAHNDFIQASARSGVPGGLTLVGLWVAIGVVLIRAVRLTRSEGWRSAAARAALVGSAVFLVASLTEATFYDEEVRAILVLIWSVGAATLYKGPEPPEGE